MEAGGSCGLAAIAVLSPDLFSADSALIGDPLDGDQPMTLYDNYAPRLPCPICGGATADYQGYDGPCAYIDFRQGESPIADPGWTETCDLPDQFQLFVGSCPSCGLRNLSATGIAESGMWISSSLVTTGKAIRIDREIAICDDCEACINTPTNSDAGYCQKCKRFVELRDIEDL